MLAAPGLGRDYEGTDLRWTLKTRLFDTPLTLVGGVAYDVLSEHRQGYQNFVGNTLGVLGALRRDEVNDVTSFDQYAMVDRCGCATQPRRLHVHRWIHRRRQSRR